MNRQNNFATATLSWIAVLCSCQIAAAVNWNTSVNGAGPHSWNTNGNWSGTFPNGVGAVANVSADWTAAPTINLNQAITVGSLTTNDTGGSGDVFLTFNPNGGSLTFDNGGLGATLTQSADASTNSIAAQITLADNLTVNTTPTGVGGNMQLNLALRQSGGHRSITKIGARDLLLRGNGATFSGGIVVNDGTIRSSGTNAETNSFGNNPIQLNGATARAYIFNAGAAGEFFDRREITGNGVLGNVSNTDINLRIHSLKDGEFSGSGNGTIGLQKFGPATYTLTGSVGSIVSGSASSVQGGTLEIDGATALSSGSFSAFTVGSGGTLMLDNRTTNVADRYRNAASLTLKSGRFEYYGNAGANSAETLGQLATGGFSSIHITPGATKSAVVTFNDYAGGGVMNISNTGGTLGGGGASDPGLKFNSGLTQFGPAGKQIVYRFIVNGQDFGAYNATNGVKALPAGDYSAGFDGTSTEIALLNLAGGENVSGAQAAGALKLNNSSGSSKTFTVNASSSLTLGNGTSHGTILKTGADEVVLASAATTGTYASTTSSIIFYVNEGNLRITGRWDTPGQTTETLLKAGPGLLTFEGTLAAGNIILPYAADGAIRINKSYFAGGQARGLLNGGVIEFTGGGTVTMGLGNITSGVRWGEDGDGGNTMYKGGFAASGSDINIDLGTAGASSMTWGTTTHFVQDGQSYLLGSTTADAKVTLIDNISLGTATTAMNFREFYVTDNTDSTTDLAEISGQLSGGTQSHLLKNGAGTLILSNGNNTYEGATYIRQGTLQVDGTIAATSDASNNPFHSAVRVQTSGTLSGTGVVNRRVEVESGGFLAPGASPGSLIVSSLDLQAGGTLAIELAGTNFAFNATEDYDRLRVSGDATLAGNLSVSLISGFTLEADMDFGVLDAIGALSTQFAGLAEGAVVLTNSGFNLFITYQGNINGDAVSRTGGNDIVLYTIPEPGTMAMLLVGCAALFLFKRSR